MRNSVTLIGSFALAIAVIIGTAHIISGVVLGILATAGFYILLIKGPGAIRRLVHQFPLLADLGFTFLAYGMFPRGLIGFIAAASTAVLVSLIIEVDKRVYVAEEKPKGRFAKLRGIARS